MATVQCGDAHPMFNVQCQSERRHEGDHSYTSEDGTTATWPQKKVAVERIHSREQVQQMMADHEVLLEQTLDGVKNDHSLASDLINTLVPAMQTQLFLIKQVLGLSAPPNPNIPAATEQ